MSEPAPPDGPDDGAVESGVESNGERSVESAVTQLMPVVRVEPQVVDAPTVRAVARRVASALPALGGDDGPREVPQSTQATVDRRRRAARAHDGATPSPSDAETPGTRPRPPEPEPLAAGPMVAGPMVGGPVEAEPVTTEPVTMAIPDGAGVPDGVGVPDGAGAPGEARVADSAGVADPTVASGTDPLGVGRSVPVTLSGVPLGDAQTDEWVDLAPQVEERHRAGGGESTVAAGAGSASFEVPPVEASAPRADSAAPGGAAPGGAPSADSALGVVSRRFDAGSGDHGGAAGDGGGVDHPGQVDHPGRADSGAGADSDEAGAGEVDRAPIIGELIRPGPQILDADSWETEPEESRNEAYHGRRRAPAPALRLWIIIGLVVLGLGAAVALPMVLTSASQPGAAPLSAPAVTDPALTPTPDGQLISATSAPGVSPTAPSPAPLVATVAPASPTVPPASPTAPSASPTASATQTGAFVPLSREADSSAHATLFGSAEVSANPCGVAAVVVREVGDWPNSSGDGRIVFKPLSIPAAGQYVMTVHYIMSPGESRVLVVTVNGAASLHTFSNHDDCAMHTRQVTMTLGAGPKTIELGNPNGRAPTIDKIVITKA